ncbi:MAG: UDP-glucose/GDP-mannose dehydrogenase family protein [Deltaproteobacteria bacterium]|nr:UDP-glucose/GDP-mannose dehydrogenase family protein [Deltaproteobacteria bacterium]MCW5802364.1 UDP-glucose/GDP-mannose dehydrogenase family protein [Deltaproteobacteria bacterium]
MNLAVIGTGYVGLVSGAGFAELGHNVTCVDIDAARIAQLERGEMPIVEPNLPEIVRRHAAHGRMRFTTDLAAAVANAQVVFIAVPTPSNDNGSADLRFVLDGAREIGRAIARYTVVVTKSTVPVGTADRVREAVARETRHPFAVVSNPEFLKEGTALADFLKPARIVVGAEDPRAIAIMRELYRPLMRTSDRMLVMDTRSAELAKYASNAMLATRISFMNELASLAESVGADIDMIRKTVGSDPRIGTKFLFAGCGFGGSCFSKDLRALVHTGREHDVHLTIAQSVYGANERQKHVLGIKVVSHFGGKLAGRRICVWGLSFKPETDDIRDAPALTLIAQLRNAGGAVVAYDPVAIENARLALGEGVEFAHDPYEAATGASALVLVTEWHELRNPDLERLKACMKEHILFDGRNVWSAQDARDAGFTYHGIGRP